MKRATAITVALLLLPALVRLLPAQGPAPSQTPLLPPTFTLTDLGPVQNGGPPGGVTAVNNSAQVVGTILDSTGSYQHAFSWQNGTITDLGSLPGGNLSYGYGVNNSGQIAGVAQLSAATFGNTLRAVIWQNGAITSLDPSAANSGFYSGAFAINSGGDVAGYTNDGADHPVIWKGGTASGLFALTPLSGVITPQGRALAINNAGQSVGTSVASGNITDPVFWDANGNVTDLGTFGAASANSANAINSNGLVVGYSQLPLSSGIVAVHAFLWQNGALQDLGVVPGTNAGGTTDTSSSAWSINSNGDIVGISSAGMNPAISGIGGRAFLYTAGTMYDLTTLLAPSSGTGWQLENAYAINDSRQIVGVGIATDHTEHGYLLTPAISPTTTALSGSVSPSVFGQQVSLSATVAPSGSSLLTPTGSVTFSDGATVLGTVALTAGTAILNSSSLGVGSHAITAAYAGDNNFSASTSSSLAQTVNQGTTTASVSASPNPGIFGQPVTLTAAVSVVAPAAGSPTGTVTFVDGTTALGTATLSGGQAAFTTSSLSQGSHSITVTCSGDTNFLGSTSSVLSLGVTETTTTSLVAAPNPANAGQPVTLAAAVTPGGSGTPTGTVSFLDGPVTLGSAPLTAGTATLITSSLVPGNHSLEASYSGDANFTSSMSTQVSLTVILLPAVITDNEAITIKDTVSSPDVFDREAVNVTDAVTVTPLINVAAPVVDYSAGRLGFGNVAAGQTGTQSLTLSDIGQAPLTVSFAALSLGSSFAISQISCSNGAISLPTTLPAGGACIVLISYLVPSGGAVNDTLTFTDNAALSNVASALEGSSYTQAIALNGSGSSTPPPPPPPAVVAILDNEDITVTDTASFPDVFSSEAVQVADVVFLTPLINVVAPVVDYSAGSLGFGNVAAGQTGAQSLTLSDIGQAPLVVSSAALSPGSAFSISQISCSNGAASLPTTLPVGGACVLIISYPAPSGPASSDVLTFTDSAELSNLPSLQAGSSYTQSVSLTGSGANTPPPPPPPAVIPITDNETVSVTDSLSFPDVSDQENVTVTDQVTIQILNSTTTSIMAAGVAYGTPAGATVFVNSSTGAVGGSVTLSLDNGAPVAMPLSGGSASFSLAVLTAGNHVLRANFAAQGGFGGSSAQATLVVSQASPTLTWANPAPISFGSALSATQLNATASVPGSFAYNPAAGTVLTVGNHALSATFSPTDSTDYTTVTRAVTIAVLNTSVGTSVNVTPVDTTTGLTPVTVSFSSVTKAGITSLTTASSGTPPPQGFRLGNPPVYFDLSTTAVFAGPVTICMSYTSSTFLSPTGPRFFHFENGAWVDRTVSINTANKTVCGSVTSFSPFAVFDPIPTLTITAGNVSRQYGRPNPTFGVSYGGFVNGDTLAALSGTLSCITPATAASLVGTYTITCGGLTSPIYAITYVPGVLTITPAPLVVTVANAQRVYGAPNPAFTGTITGIQNGDSITATYASAATPASPVGTYTILPALADPGSKLANYFITLINGTLTIVQASTATKLSVAPNPSDFGQAVTLSATVAAVSPGAGTATGKVTFLDGSVTLGTGALSSADIATFTTSSLTSGKHNLTATYAGDPNFTVSSSSAVSDQVLCGALIDLSPSSVAAGGTITVTAQVISCSSTRQTVVVQFSLIGPAQPNSCSSTKSVMFTTPPFPLAPKTSQKVSFPFIVPSRTCPGTYTFSAETLGNGVAVNTSTASLTVTAR